MKSFLNIDKKTRFLVLYLDGNMKVSHISKILKVPLSTLYDWVATTGKDEGIRKIKSGRGAKPKVDKTKGKEIQREIREAPQRSSLRKIGGKFEVGKTAVGNWMHKKGYKYKKCHQEMVLEDEEKESRVDFCQLRWRRMVGGLIKQSLLTKWASSYLKPVLTWDGESLEKS